MRHITRIFAAFFFLMITCSPSFAQTQSGYSVTCDNGAAFDNGVEIVVNQMRSGFTYTATAVGLNGFDPVLAVLDENGDGLCDDDDPNAEDYAAELPTTGEVIPSGLSSQVTFAQNLSPDFADVSLVVGGFNNQVGEFLLILEGMAVTAADNAGDPFSVLLTPGMIESGVPLSVYMLTRGQSGVDPFLFLADQEGSIAQDPDGVPLSCDDAGTTLCHPAMSSLEESSVTIETGRLPTWQYDAMLSLNMTGYELSTEAAEYFTFYMTSYERQSQGEYLLVFHIANGVPESAK